MILSPPYFLVKPIPFLHLHSSPSTPLLTRRCEMRPCVLFCSGFTTPAHLLRPVCFVSASIHPRRGGPLFSSICDFPFFFFFFCPPSVQAAADSHRACQGSCIIFRCVSYRVFPKTRVVFAFPVPSSSMSYFPAACCFPFAVPCLDSRYISCPFCIRHCETKTVTAL